MLFTKLPRKPRSIAGPNADSRGALSFLLEHVLRFRSYEITSEPFKRPSPCALIRRPMRTPASPVKTHQRLRLRQRGLNYSWFSKNCPRPWCDVVGRAIIRAGSLGTEGPSPVPLHAHPRHRSRTRGARSDKKPRSGNRRKPETGARWRTPSSGTCARVHLKPRPEAST